MSDRKLSLSTAAVMGEHFAPMFRRWFLRGMWFPITVTVVAIASPLIKYGFVRETGLHLAYGLLFAAVIWAFHWAAVQRDVLAVKYAAAAGKLDEVLQSQDGRWEWCEESEGYAVHFGDDPHDEDADADEAGDTEK